MKDQLIQYVNLLFAGAPDAGDIRQEILQNTMDRYDDLISQGKSPQAAYQLAISGIGDISEILGSAAPDDTVTAAPEPKQLHGSQAKLMRAVAIAMYICCVVPVIILEPLGYNALGVCLMFLLIAAATALIILSSRDRVKKTREYSQKDPLRKSIDSIMTAISLIAFFALSFATNAWHITWLVFPIVGSVEGIIHAILDLKEAK